jgi:anti-sigma B factor antagonist
MPPGDDIYAVCTLTNPRPGCSVVRIDGELDTCSAPSVNAAIVSKLGKDCNSLVVDLSNLEFIDSSGIRLLVQLASQVAPRSMVVMPPVRGCARRALDLVGFSRIAPIVSSLDEVFADGIGTVA